MGEIIEYAEDATKLKWRFEERRDGEIGRFSVCGLHAQVQDCDGDFTVWSIRKGASGPLLAKGERSDVNHFFGSLRDAEAALRTIITNRIADLRFVSSPSPLAEER